MAKWGEGDPRWIVEERPDATNVNNWHWTEKNACGWSKEKLRELLIDLKIENDIAKCNIKEVEKLEGEAVANNRKGKLIFFYEWDIILKWSGKLEGGEKEAEGSINIPNLSEENDVSEVELVTMSKSSPEADKLKEFLMKEGRDIIREQLNKYVVALKEEFSQGMILPKKDEVKSNNDTVASLSAGFNKQVHMNNTDKNDVKGCKINTTTLEFTEKFQCTGEEFYNAMTVIEMVQAFTHGPVKLEPKKDGKFELFGGNVHGSFIELIPSTKIVQHWRFKRWPAEHYSTVTFKIEQKDDHTEVKVVQTSVPQSEADSTKENWDRYYWEAMKRTFGFGSFFV
ncbi:hypothetical protein L9F63_003178 [Diploptera punctata]|uniref:Activator of Hsp90 ATPase AHSA1-like N-terminal domain-containing protein n=1 Tax=Diploptera punctata TaxID=6984 RepID=A0AAD7ZKQ5_DIPPU|nr:hypothetical protein L9F63_003178 [Diploptera punctata]